MQKIRVWDLPLRVFHWSFALVVVGAIISNIFDWMEIHSYCGYSAFVLVIFRIIWGIVGPTNARFVSFIPKHAELKSFIRDQQTNRLGHNPLGALSVIGILAVMLIQSGSGLFVDNDVDFKGPLNQFVSAQVVDVMNAIHGSNHWLVYGLVALHLSAIYYYQRIKKQDLIGPMISGDKLVEEEIIQNEKSLASKDNLQIRILGMGILTLTAALFWYFVLA